MKRAFKGLGRRVFDILAQGLAALLVLAVGLLLGHPRSVWLESALIVALTAVAATLSALLIAQYFAQHVETVMSDRLGDAANLALMRPDAVGELWTQEQLCALERTIKVRSIWVIGEKHGNDAKSPFREVIMHNIAKGVTYVYIAPDAPVPRRHLTQLRTAVGVPDGDNRLRTMLLSETDWRHVPYKDGNFTIYTPADVGVEASGYFWYPGADGASFGRLGEDVVVRWAAGLEALLPDLSDVGGTPGHTS